MTTMLGAFDPTGALARAPLAIEHAFCASHDVSWVAEALRGIVARGRMPLLTIEPWQGAPDEATLRRWRQVFDGYGVAYVRYAHEMNSTWYPWSGDPARFRREWARWTAAMPPNVRNVFCPNVDYPDAPHRIAYYRPDDAATVHVVGVDGYARNGETPAELFRPTLDNLRSFYDAPLWICETAAPRGRTQARYATALRAYCEQQGIEAVLWLNVDKAGQGPQERDWTLTPAAERALLGERAKPPKRKRRAA